MIPEFGVAHVDRRPGAHSFIMDDQPTEEQEADLEEEQPESNFAISGTTKRS